MLRNTKVARLDRATTEDRPLTARQARFVLEYLRDLCATRAAIRAGYSARNAGKVGPRLTHKPHVARAIAGALKEESRRRQELRDREYLARCRR